MKLSKKTAYIINLVLFNPLPKLFIFPILIVLMGTGFSTLDTTHAPAPVHTTKYEVSDCVVTAATIVCKDVKK